MNPASRRTVPVCYGAISAGASGPKNQNDVHRDARDDDASPSKTASDSVCSKVLKFLYAAHLEIFVVLYLQGRAMASIAIQDLLLRKACLIHLECSQSVCDKLDNFPDVKSQAERIAGNYNMYRVIVYLGLSTVIAILTGPWCDKYGCKIPLLAANLGYIVSTVIALFTVYRMHFPLYFNVLAMISDGLSGGLVVVFMAVYSEATLRTDSKQRLSKFTTINLAMSVASPMGLYVGGQVYGTFGINAVLLVALSSLVLAEFWALFTLSAPDEGNELDDSLWTRVKSLFQLCNFLDGFRACMRPRPARGRAQLWCLLVALCFCAMDVTRLGVAYYFVRKMYSWSVPYYSTVIAITSAATAVLNLPIIWFLTSVVKLPDIWTSIVGVSFNVAQLLLCGLANQEWLYYLQCAVGVPSFVAYVAIRTLLSKLVERHEVGKVFSFLSSCESLLPILGEVVFTQVFNWSLDFMPGLVYLTAAAVSTFPLVLLGYCAHVLAQSYAPVEECCETNG